MAASKYIMTMVLASAVAIPTFAITGAEEIKPSECLDFLYSTMTLPDKLDYPREFYERNVATSLQARRELPWGETVPEREFKHFVLPVRVNNENLDSARWVFYKELKPRVEGLSMKDAILAVNHWCHEKVTYRPSDGRTSSPLSCVSQAIGRCGEESTFTVAALRSVGIPARQIYTPRWAHTDDNHAWVEAWADGKWYFLGACEPEPILNLAWFNSPASRGMLMSTNVVGDYRGPEEVLLRQPLSTRINVTSNYAPTATLPVKVLTADGQPAAGATVNFCIYNYAEYFPAVSKTADSGGNASLDCGLGDMLVWATDGNSFGFAKGNPADFGDGRKPLTVVIDKTPDYNGVFELTLTPPAAGAKLPSVTEAQRNANNLMLAREDSIRSAYEATFATPAQAEALARELGLDPVKLTSVLVESRGNHAMIQHLLSSLPTAMRERALSLLTVVSEKDRRDITPEVIEDALKNTDTTDHPSDFYNRYVLSPRIEIEGLRPWRAELRKFFASDRQKYVANPAELVKWVDDNIADATPDNPLRLRISPLSVLTSRRADPLSRNIFFVAAARSLGIPARIDPVTGATQYSVDSSNWVDVKFRNAGSMPDATDGTTVSKGALALTFTPEEHVVDPKYYSQFSVSRINSGVPSQLEFDENGTVSSLFATPYQLDPGQYILTSGQRLANGSVLARSEIFTVNPGETSGCELILRQATTQLSVIGALNAENIYHDLASDADKSLLSTTGRGYYVLGLIRPSHEPSAHAINDISAMADRLEAQGAKIMLLFDNENEAARFNHGLFGRLPDNVVFGIDNGGVSRHDIEQSLHLESPDAPLFVIADTFNRIVWVSTGYTIGMGETLLRHLSTLK